MNVPYSPFVPRYSIPHPTFRCECWLSRESNSSSLFRSLKVPGSSPGEVNFFLPFCTLLLRIFYFCSVLF
ncbi:hypothetical protein KC354_g63 [Hortaea werneckii]|nr:hypothetical protein KC354_g63 [Hortaea werneckii]